MAENGTIELNWKNPGRIETKKGDTKDEDETLKDEEDQKEDVSIQSKLMTNFRYI